MLEKFLKLINLPQDKANHAFYGLLLYNIVSIMYDTYIAIGAVVLVGIGKEVYDYFHRDEHTPEVNDALAFILAPFVLHITTVTMSML